MDGKKPSVDEAFSASSAYSILFARAEAANLKARQAAATATEVEESATAPEPATESRR